MASIRSAVWLGRVAKFAAILILAPAVADAASFVKVVGTRTRNNVVNDSVGLVVGSSGVASGNSIIVTVQVANLASGAISCADPRNGAYDVDVSSAPGGAAIAIASKHQAAGLFFGDVVSCSYPIFNGFSSLGVYEFSGLDGANPLDRTSQSASASAGAASSGLTASTSQAAELVFGLAWVPGGTTFTPATSGSNPLENPYSPGWSQPTFAGTQKPVYRFVNSVRQYEANGTVVGTGGWIAEVATYRLAPDLCTDVNCDDVNECTDDACDPATGLCSHVPAGAGTVCGDLSSGICDAPDTCDGAGACASNNVADGTPCSEVDSDCEIADTCLAGACHDNGFKSPGASCGDATNTECNAADTCNASGLCMPNLAAGGTPCGDPSSSACDAADFCDSGSCLVNHVASGTPCDDGEACTNADACDGSGLCGGTRDELCFACIGNTAPVADPVIVASPGEPVSLASGLVEVTASFTDTGGQSWSCTVDWGDGSAPDSGVLTEPTATEAGSCSGSHLYTAVGVYEVAVGVSDSCGEGAGALYQYVVVYDPGAGFVTGGGWITSPAGAFIPNPALTGRAHFGFVAAYLKGNATVPSGRTDFHFNVANFLFTSSEYEWLVVSGAKARFRGTGQVNGSGSYGFALTGWDGEAPGGGGIDRFRIRIWDKNQGDMVVYDNQVACPNQGDNADPCTEIGEGAIVIHKKPAL